MKIFILLMMVSLALPVDAAGGNQSPASTIARAAKQPTRQNKANSNVASKGQEPMEEVTVVGQRQLMTLRQQVFQAEDRAYEIFDRLNTDDDYDIHCRMVAITGTHIRQRICLPNFYRQATAAEAQQYLALIGTSDYAPVAPSSQNVFAYKIPILKAKVLKAATEHPEMLAALRKLLALKKELNKESKIYFGGTNK